MIFSKKKEEPLLTPEPVLPVLHLAKDSLLVFVPPAVKGEGAFEKKLQQKLPSQPIHFGKESELDLSVSQVKSVLAVDSSSEILNQILDRVILERKRRNDGTPILVITHRFDELTKLGEWLYQRACSEQLEGVRLIVSDSLEEICERVPEKLTPIHEPNVIKMPVNTEVQDSLFKYFYAISPAIRSVVKEIKELAENNIGRIYLLGAPGAGKTSLAYYYYLCRGAKGNFITINLTAESTGEKAAMKSLLCGHVPGAIPGVAGAREGALSFARDGVCFLDESHGVTDVVMEVLTEVLDTGQYLPYGAGMKRSLECAVIFASNRSWDTLRSLVPLDEHARLGATIVKVKDLAVREEDLIAVLATTLAKFKSQCTTWTPPQGLSKDAWQAIRKCSWRGNIRALVRVIETACVSFCSGDRQEETLLDLQSINEAISLWEPHDAKETEIYTSYQ